MNDQELRMAVECQLLNAGNREGLYADALKKFADLIRADEREAIAQMFEDAPALVPFAQNDKGGCMMCGFTPKLVMEAIRARGNT